MAPRIRSFRLDIVTALPEQVFGPTEFWLRGHLLEVAIVVLTPPFLPASLQALRAVRAMRLLRLLRVPKLLGRVFSIDGLRYAAVLALLTALGGGAAFSEIEKDRSTWDGVWWAVTTMTTVGYGDTYPTTTLGIAAPALSARPLGSTLTAAEVNAPRGLSFGA